MKYAIALLLIGCWIAPPVGAEIITMDTTIDSPHALGRVLIFDGPQGPTTVEVVDGAVIPNSIEVYGHSVLNIRGGVTNSFVSGYDNSTINIFHGLVATGEDVEMFHDSVANIYGGHFGDDIEAKDSATVNLYGGTFEKTGGGAFLSVQGDGVMNVYLREYEIVDVEGFDRLVGVLRDGSDINVIVWVDSFEVRSARIVLHTIPEPESLTLTVIMGLILVFHALTRRKRPFLRTGRSGRNSISKSGKSAMKYAITMLLIGCWIAPPVGAEIITMDTTIDSPHAGGTIQIYDGPDSPTTVDVVDGAVIQSSIVVNGHSVLNIRGGTTNSFIFGRDYSTVNIFDGLIATGEDVEMEDDRVANIYGGHFGDDIEASGSATVNLYGGTFEKAGSGATLQVQGDAIINLYLREFETFRPEPFQGIDRLVGILLDGSPIDVELNSNPFELRNARFVLHTIPEPDSLTLAFMMGLVLGFRALTRRNRGVRRTRLR